MKPTAAPARGRLRRATSLLVSIVCSALVLSGCSIYDVPLPGGASTGDNPMRITVMFRDVLDLVPQSTVKIDDVTVGKVKSVKLKGYVAKVSIEVRKDLDLPDNARAEIRQTSLLGEKFVSLSKPQEPSSGKLSDKDVIGLDRTGRNPEVEEVLGALSLLLNGGGVGQLKTIVSEINNAVGGRESEVRSVLDQIRSFMGQLDTNKAAIVTAIENTNRLAVQLRKQDRTIKSALDNVPATLRSVNRQRDDLVKLLEALSRLSGVGVRVIKASKESTINSLRSLAPVLSKFAEAGENLPKAFQVFLTYPFIDEAVGRDPQVARNLHMGDYTNLSVNLDIALDQINLPDLPGIPVPTALCQAVTRARAQVARQVDALPLLSAAQKKSIKDLVLAEITDKDCNITVNQVRLLIAAALKSLGEVVTAPLCERLPKNPLCQLLLNPTAIPTLGVGGLTGGTGAGNNGLGGLTKGLLPRAEPGKGYQAPQQIDPFGLAARGLDPGVGTMLLQGVAEVR